MTIRLLLPPGAYNLGNPAPGTWDQHRGFGVLKIIADDMHATKDLGERAADLVSIPDVWAQTETFEAALSDNKHPMHRRAIGEWRGLLAMLALLRQRDLALSVQQLGFPSTQKSLDEGKPSFAAVLRALLPTGTLLPDQSWDRVALVTYRDSALGLLVPTTLVCPVRDYWMALDDAISFRSGGRLVDPCTVDGIIADDLLIVGRFASRLAESVSEAVAKDTGHAPSRADMLLKEIRSFAEDCERTAKRKVADDQYQRRDVPHAIPHPIFREFQTVETLATAAEFQALATPRREFVGLFKGAILIDPEMQEAIGLPARQIRVWGIHTLEEWRDRPEIREKISREAAQSGFLVLSYNDLFTAHLCSLGDDTVRRHPEAAKSFVLPLSPLLLLLLTPDQIARSLSVQAQLNQATVSLSLTVQDSSGHRLTLTPRRVYSKAERTWVAADAGARLVTWPNFTHPQWTRHFLFHSGNPEKEVLPVACFNEAAVRETVGGDERGNEAVVNALRSIAAGLTSLHAVDRPPRGSALVEGGVFKLSQPPEAVLCEFGPEAHTVGLILFRELEAAPSGRAATEIGVDFGTTNTIVYAREGTNPPTRLQFSNRCISPYGEDLGPDDQAIISTEFLPPFATSVPFLSLLRQRVSIAPGNAREPVVTDRIFYLFDIGKPINELLSERASGGGSRSRDSIRFDLKWAEETRENREAIELFLAQVTLQALAEVTARGSSPTAVRWHFSYPDAFTAFHREDFKALLPQAIQSALGTPQHHPKIEELLSESLAAAFYFGSDRSEGKHAYFSESVLTLDVGGGTTDVSLWQNRKLAWQASFMLAGRNLLINFLRHNAKLADAMASNRPQLVEPVKAVALLARENASQLDTAIEMLVNHPTFANAFSSDRPRLSGVPEYKQLTAIAELALAGMLFYVGSLMRRLHQDGKFDLNRGTVYVCLGGRGSLLFKNAIISSQQDRIGELFRKAAGLREPVRIEFSAQPKEEVASGLLVRRDQALGLETAGAVTDFIMGERMSVGGQPFEADTFSRALPHEAEWRTDDLPELHEFLALAANCLNRSIEIPPDMLVSLRDEVRDQINEQHRMRVEEAAGRRPPGRRTVGMQPAFILALRGLVERLIVGHVDLPSLD